MGTTYVDMGGSRIASHDGIAQSASDNASVTGWYRDSDIMFCHTIYTSKGPLTRQFKLQYRNVTDSGAWTDIGDGTGEIRYDDVDTVIPSDDYTITIMYRICSIVSGYTWQNGIGNVGDNLILSTGGYTINDEYYTEFQWALGVGYTTLNKTYEFRAYDITLSYAHAAFGAQLTINSSDIEATGSRLWGESTLGSPTYRYDWTEWLNKGTWTSVTPVNGAYGQLNQPDVVSPVFRFGGAKSVKIIDNLYGLLGSGLYKIFVRAYPSIFPYNATDTSVPWTPITIQTSNPYGMFTNSDGFYKYAQVRIVETSGSTSDTGIFMSCYSPTSYYSASGATLLIRETDKTGWCAGVDNGGGGQLPTGSTSNLTFRSIIAPMGKSWSHCSVALNNSAWLDTNGFAWCGGSNTYGVLGQNNTTSYPSSLVSVLGAHQFSKIACADTFIAALKPDGSAWNWGNKLSIGNGDYARATHVLSPVSVVGNHSFVELYVSWTLNCALKSDGTVWAWGDTESGDFFGSGVRYNSPGYISYQVSPVKVSADLSVKRILRFAGTSAVFDVQKGTTGDFWLIGSGNISPTYSGAPRTTIGSVWDYSLIQRYVTVAACRYAWAGIDADGVIWTWGNTDEGQDGRLNPVWGTVTGLTAIKYTSRHSPVYGGRIWKAVYGGFQSNHFMAVDSTNVIRGWGWNTKSALACFSYDHFRYPISARGGSPWA